MTTEAGRRLLGWFGGPMRDEKALIGYIAAIEAEAVTADRERIADGVEGLRDHGEYLRYRGWIAAVERAAVLAIVREEKR